MIWGENICFDSGKSRGSSEFLIIVTGIDMEDVHIKLFKGINSGETAWSHDPEILEMKAKETNRNEPRDIHMPPLLGAFIKVGSVALRGVGS